MTTSKHIVRGNGSKWEIKPGVFQFRFNMGKDPVSGKYLYSPKRTLHCEGKSKRTQQAMLRTAMEDYKRELNDGVAPRATVETVGEYATRFHRIRRNELGSPLAYEREELDIKHINELFGTFKINEIKPSDIREAYEKSRESGRFSGSELKRIHVKLKQVLESAVDDDLIRKNPCKKVQTPRVEKTDVEGLSLEEARRFSATCYSEPPSPQVVCNLLMIDTGIRKGEALGLEWKHVNECDATITIIQQYTSDKVLRPPKSSKSRRVISISDTLLHYLKGWKDIQAREFQQKGLTQDQSTPLVHSYSISTDRHGNHTLVVKHMDNHNYSRWFRNFCVDNGFGTYENVKRVFVKDGKTHIRGSGYTGLHPHMLRHTQATLLIGNGADVKTVQTRLGHASPNTTLSIYSHAISTNDQKAAQEMDELLNGPNGTEI